MATTSEEQPKRRSVFRWIAVLVAGVLCFVAVGLCFWHAVQSAREAAYRASCTGQMKMFGLALHNYHDVHGCFPPAYFADAEGRPAHTWRVLLLPAQEDRPLYDRYRFDEAWNGPHNRAMAEGLSIGMSGIVPMYHCPTDRDSGPFDTSFVVIVGDEAAFPGAATRRFKDFADGSTNTVIMAEMSESGIHWMEPRDLEFDDMSFRLNDPGRKCIRSKHPGVAHVLFGCGSVKSVSELTLRQRRAVSAQASSAGK
jgi:hypothetical protein